jgi:hypothetical protein
METIVSDKVVSELNPEIHGNVLINTSTDSGNKLEVNGTARFGSVIVGSLSTGTVYSNAGTLTNTNPSDQRLKNNLIWYKRALAGVTVVIPTKNNQQGLTALIRVLEASEGVSRVVVVGDGIETEPILKTLPSSVIKTYVPRGAGISAMWNHGMQLANAGDHVSHVLADLASNNLADRNIIEKDRTAEEIITHRYLLKE